jgi:hypothetical protein
VCALSLPLIHKSYGSGRNITNKLLILLLKPGVCNVCMLFTHNSLAEQNLWAWNFRKPLLAIVAINSLGQAMRANIETGNFHQILISDNNRSIV